MRPKRFMKVGKPAFPPRKTILSFEENLIFLRKKRKSFPKELKKHKKHVEKHERSRQIV